MITRVMQWSVRREIWENRSIYIAPLCTALLYLFGFMLSRLSPHRIGVQRPFDAAAVILIATAFIVAIFYCVDAMQSERRDRSILFWKSLPVSDRTTVLAKVSIPMVVIPAITFATVVTLQIAMLLWSTTWINVFFHALILLYGLIVMSLWFAPIYAWLLMVSAWAKRAVVLWAVLPWMIAGMLERLIFGTSLFGFWMKQCFMGFMEAAFETTKQGQVERLDQLRPGNFLITPGLWTGLIVAALFLWAAVKLRRGREPI